MEENACGRSEDGKLQPPLECSVGKQWEGVEVQQYPTSQRKYHKFNNDKQANLKTRRVNKTSPNGFMR